MEIWYIQTFVITKHKTAPEQQEFRPQKAIFTVPNHHEVLRRQMPASRVAASARLIVALDGRRFLTSGHAGEPLRTYLIITLDAIFKGGDACAR